MANPTTVTHDEYAEATECYVGWCLGCKAFTRESTEPDAKEYDCPLCGQPEVIGAEDALLLGVIDVI